MNQSQSNKAESLSKNASSLKKVKSSLTIEEPKKGTTTFNFFYLNGEQLISFKIPIVIYSVKDAIQQSIEILNRDFNLNLKDDYQKYELFAAKKTGKKKSDLPSFDYTQKLENTKIENFCIQPKPNEIVTIQSPPPINSNLANQTQTRLIKEIKEQPAQYQYYRNSMIKQGGKNKQISPEPEPGCFCFSKKK